MVGKIYAGILVERFCKMTKGLIDDGCLDKIFTLKQIDEKKWRVYVGFIDLEKAYECQ